MYNYSFVFSLLVTSFSGNVSNTVQPMRGGIQIPSMGLGTFTATNERTLSSALNRALEVGYRHIDTAPLYENEHIIGKVLNEWFALGKLKRRDLFITTKLHALDMFPERVEFALKESLSRLQVKYVDAYLIHLPVALKERGDRTYETAPTDLLGIWKKMEEQVKARRARTIGISNFNIHQIKRIIRSASIKPSILQTEVHPYYQQKHLREFCRKHNILVIGYAPLGSPGAKEYFRSIGLSNPATPSLHLLQDPVIVKLAAKYKKTPAQLVLRYLHQLHVVVIPKSTDHKRIKGNTKIFNFEISLNDTKLLKDLDRGAHGKIFHLLNFAEDMYQHPEYPFLELLEYRV